MISFFYIGLCFYLSYQVSVGVVKQTPIFKEYKQRSVIALFVWLVPVGAMVNVLLPPLVGWLIPYLVSTICFLIVAFEARIRSSKFEISGTNKTTESIKILQLATLASIVGFLYLGVQVVYIFLDHGLQY